MKIYLPLEATHAGIYSLRFVQLYPPAVVHVPQAGASHNRACKNSRIYQSMCPMRPVLLQVVIHNTGGPFFRARLHKAAVADRLAIICSAVAIQLLCPTHLTHSQHGPNRMHLEKLLLKDGCHSCGELLWWWCMCVYVCACKCVCVCVCMLVAK